MEYAVVVTYDFDPETCVYLFNTWDEAVEYMKGMWKFCREWEKENCESFDEDGTWCDERQGCAEIRWNDGELTHRRWMVAGTSEPMRLPNL